MALLERVVIDGQSKKVCYETCSGPYKIYQNVTNEFSDMKWLVCRDCCSKQTIVGAFNDEEDAEDFCSIKNLKAVA